MEFGDLRGSLGEIIRLLKTIDRNTNDNACCAATTSAGTNSSVPQGFNSVSIVQTSVSGTVTITMSDGSTFELAGQGQGYSVSAAAFQYLTAYAISSGGGATWQWSAIK